jgi:hypothetical protein
VSGWPTATRGHSNRRALRAGRRRGRRQAGFPGRRHYRRHRHGRRSGRWTCGRGWNQRPGSTHPAVRGRIPGRHPPRPEKVQQVRHRCRTAPDEDQQHERQRTLHDRVRQEKSEMYRESPAAIPSLPFHAKSNYLAKCIALRVRANTALQRNWPAQRISARRMQFHPSP